MQTGRMYVKEICGDRRYKQNLYTSAERIVNVF